MIKKLLLIFLFCFFALAGTHRVLAQQTNCDPSKGYCLLAPIPIGGNTTSVANQVDIVNYIPNAVKLIIALSTGLAVLMIIFGGFQYIASTIPNVKTNGKEMINNALIGLLLITASYSILYTLNPKLVQLSLSLSPIADAPPITGNLAAGTPTTGDTSGGITGTTSAGTCNGNTGSTCVQSQTFNFPQKGAGNGCSGSNCYVDPTLGAKLDTLTAALQKDGIDGGKTGKENDWIVTELDPPTVGHGSGCHVTGTCVDAALVQPNGAAPSVSKITTFLTDINSNVSPSFLYEVTSCARVNTLRQQIHQFSKQILACHTTTGESAHINSSGSAGTTCGTYVDSNGATQDNNVQC